VIVATACTQRELTAALAVVFALAVSVARATATSDPQLVKRIDTGGRQPCGSAVFGKYLYVDNYGSGTIARIYPTTNRVVKKSRVGGGPCGVVAGGGALWVENFYGSTIARVNPATLKVTAKIRVAGSPCDVAYGFGSVWSSNFYAGTVSRINPKTRRIVKTMRTGGSPACTPCGKRLDLGRLTRNGADLSHRPANERGQTHHDR
jgi:YVTN family beta-propeller protein